MSEQCTTVNVEDEQVVVTADCEELELDIVDSVVVVEIADIGIQGEPGIGGTWGTILGDILNQLDLQAQFATKIGDVLADGETLTFGDTSNHATISYDAFNLVVALNGFTGNFLIEDESGNRVCSIQRDTGAMILEGKAYIYGGIGLVGQPIQNFSEGNQLLEFVAGAKTLDVALCENGQYLSLTQNSAITTSGVPFTGKPITLNITHTGGPWTLSWNGTDLELEGAAGDTETVLIVWNGSAYVVNRGGVVDLTI